MVNGHISNPRYRPRPLPAAPLVARRRYLIVVPRPMPAAPRRCLIVVPRPLPAAPLVVRRRYLIEVPRPFPAAPLVVRRRFLVVAVAAGEEQLGRCSAKQRKYYRLYLSSGKVTLAAM